MFEEVSNIFEQRNIKPRIYSIMKPIKAPKYLKAKVDLREYIDPVPFREEFDKTLERLYKAKKPQQIAEPAIAKLIGIGNINQKTIKSTKFLQIMIDLAPNLESAITPHGLSYHVDEMMIRTEWKDEEEKLRQKVVEGDLTGEDIFILIQKAKPGDYETIVNAFEDKGINNAVFLRRNFDGECDGDAPEIHIGGSVQNVIEALKMLEAEVGSSLGFVIKYVSRINKFERDNQSLEQALALAEAELED